MSKIDEREEILERMGVIADHVDDIREAMCVLAGSKDLKKQHEELMYIRTCGNLILDNIEEMFTRLDLLLFEYGVGGLEELDKMISEKVDRILGEERRKQK